MRLKAYANEERNPRNGRYIFDKPALVCEGTMQLKLFLLPVKNLSAAEAEMNASLRSHRVLAVKKELVADEKTL